MKSDRTRRLWTTVLAIVVGIAFGISASRLVDVVWQIRDGSAVAALSAELVAELQSYYREHGVYPPTLEGMPPSFDALDGAEPGMLALFKYESIGQMFLLVRRGPGSVSGFAAACAGPERCMMLALE